MAFVPLLLQMAQKHAVAVRPTVEHVHFVVMALVMAMKPSGLVRMTVVLPITVVMEHVLRLLMKITIIVHRIAFQRLGVAMEHVADLRCATNVSQIVAHVLEQYIKAVEI